MADFFDRLDIYMNFSGLNDNQLTVLAQLSVGALGKQRKGGRGLSVDSIAKILSTCPDLNAEWLITGNGSMVKQSPDNIAPVTLKPDLTTQLLFERDEKLIRENERLIIRIEDLEQKLGVNNSPPHYSNTQFADK